MPQSRKRPGHHEMKRTSGVPSRQRVRGRILLAVLFGVFGLLIALFATQQNYWVWIIAGTMGTLLGFIIGKSMEKDASHS